MDQSKVNPTRDKPSNKSWIRIILAFLVCEKIIQHIFVTLAFYNDWGGIRSSVAVNPDVLLVLGACVTVLFIISLWGLIKRQKWTLGLLIGLSIFDIVGEFIAQGTVAIVITVSFVVAIALLILTLVYRKQLQKGPEDQPIPIQE